VFYCFEYISNCIYLLAHVFDARTLIELFATNVGSVADHGGRRLTIVVAQFGQWLNDGFDFIAAQQFDDFDVCA